MSKPQTTPSKAVALHAGPSSAASVKLAQATAANVGKALVTAAPGKLSADGRTFHVEDYRKASQLIKSLREGKCGKVNAQWVDALAASMAAVFEADSKQFGVPFSPTYFVAGTR